MLHRPMPSLALLTWRYAAMIGIVTSDPSYATDEQVKADRQRW